MSLVEDVKKNEKATKEPFPHLAKVLVVSECVLSYVVTCQFFILENIVYITLKFFKEDIIADLNMKRALGALLSIVPAWLADSYAGKYWVFSFAYMLACFWPVCLIILLYDGPTGPMKYYTFEVAAYFSLLYYCIEPVRFVILSEQLELPKQQDNLPLYFSLLFLARCIANTVASTLLAIEGQDSHFIFGHTAVLIVLFIGYIFFFMFAKKSLKGEGPSRCIYSGGIVCMMTALLTRIDSCGKKGDKRKHFMDYAEHKCDVFFIYNCKMFLKMACYCFITIFVGLTEFFLTKVTHDQMRHLVPISFLPPRYNMVDLMHPVGILWLILWNLCVLPLLHHFKIKCSDLKFFGAGYLLTGVALISAFIVEFSITRTSTMLPGQGFGQIRIFNAHPTVVAIRSPAIWNESNTWIHIPPRGLWTVARLNVHKRKEDTITFKYADTNGKMKTQSSRVSILEEESVSYIVIEGDLVRVEGFDPVVRGPPGMNSPRFPRVYVLCGLPFCFGELIFHNNGFTRTENVPDANNHYSLFVLPLGTYNVTSVYGESSNYILREIHIRVGGVYAILIYPLNHAVRGAAFFTIVKPNKLSMANVVPQIIFYSFGYYLCRIYGFIFVYTQSPPKLRCTIWAMGPYAFAIANLILTFDRTYWHHSTDVYQITVILLIHFIAFCCFIYYSYRYEPQTWGPEGAVFQGYPPLATRYQFNVRKKISFLRKTSSGSRSSKEHSTSREESEHGN